METFIAEATGVIIIKLVIFLLRTLAKDEPFYKESTNGITNEKTYLSQLILY
jgi:hypothetical protein